jgi:type IV pilus assembly protein PilY1
VTSGAIINWPDPTGSNAAKLDDLLHASINGHGGFFSAQDPQQFADALTKTLDDIVNRSASASSVSANSTQLVSGAKVHNAKYDTSKWSGELEALPINSAGVSDIPAWKASEHIPAPGDSFVTPLAVEKYSRHRAAQPYPFVEQPIRC